MNWGIRRKLLVIPIAATTLLVVALVLMLRIAHIYGDDTAGEFSEQRALADLHIAIQQRLDTHYGKLSLAVNLAVLGGRSETVPDAFVPLAQECSTILGDLDGLRRATGLQGATSKLLGEGREQLAGYCSEVSQLAAQSVPVAAAGRGYLVRAEGAYRQFNTTFTTLRDGRRQAAAAAMRRAGASLKRGLLETGALLALVALLTVGMSLSISRLVNRRVKRLADTMAQLRADPNAAVVLDLSAADEIGDIERGFSAMLSEVRAHQERLAESATRLTEVNRELELQIHSKTQAEDALRQSKEFLQMAQGAGGIGIFELDLHTGLMRGSDLLFQLFGMASGNGLITQEQWFAAVYPEDLETLIAQFGQAVNGGSQFHVEYRVLRPDGSVIWISATGRVLLDGFGAARRVIGTVADIHGRKIVEEELRRTAKSLAIAQKAGGIATFDVNVLTGDTVQSGNMREIVGVPPDQPLPNLPLWLELVHPEDRELVKHPLRVPGADGTAYQREYRIIRADGSVRWLNERGVAMHTITGDTARITGAIIDTTERKSAEAAMLELEARLERAVRGTSDVLWEWDSVTDEIWIASRFREVLGYGERDPLPATAQEFASYLHEEDVPRVDESVHKHLADGTPYDIEARMKSKSGAYEWVRIRGVADTDPTGQGRRISGSIQIITEKKRTELALIEATNAAAAASRAKSEFLANMSHEIRTPMNGVIGMTQLLADSRLTATQREYVEVIRSSGENLLALINDILDVSKIEAGRMDLEALDIDLRQIVASAITTLGASATAKGLALIADFRPDVPSTVRGDPLRLRQILFNLVGNALKFTSKGKVTVEVALESMDNGRPQVRFSVRDTGIGIAPDRLDRLFKSFSQVDSSTTRHFGGSGLGLSIVKRLTELMGGRVGVDSEVGRGSVFWFTAKFDRASASHASHKPAVPDPAPATQAAPGSFAGAHVLLVEDNAVNQKVAQKYLEKLGITSDLARNGAEAVEAWQHGRYDLILMDCQMPVMDGFEASREIRRREQDGQHVPIVALTANALASDRSNCLAAGMDEHLPKPLELTKLEACFARYLAGRSFVARTPAQEKAAPAATDTDAPVDLRALRELVGNDDDFQRELVRTFIASGDTTLAQIVEALAANDFATLRKSAHSLKGASANIRAQALSLAAKNLEAHAAGQNGEACRAQLEPLRAQYARARDYLEAAAGKKAAGG
jgi:PAS domain S-box-containing protein